jgi:hypothetical protein
MLVKDVEVLERMQPRLGHPTQIASHHDRQPRYANRMIRS